MPTPTIVELLEQEKQQQRKRIEEVIAKLEDALGTMRAWAREAGSTGKPKPILKMAAEVLKEAGKPMHADHIGERTKEI